MCVYVSVCVCVCVPYNAHNATISPKSINRLVAIMNTDYVLCDVRTEAFTMPVTSL